MRTSLVYSPGLSSRKSLPAIFGECSGQTAHTCRVSFHARFNDRGALSCLPLSKESTSRDWRGRRDKSLASHRHPTRPCSHGPYWWELPAGSWSFSFPFVQSSLVLYTSELLIFYQFTVCVGETQPAAINLSLCLRKLYVPIKQIPKSLLWFNFQ